MADYDPMAHGARCDICPLKGQKVIPPDPGTISELQLLSGTAIAIVGEAPREDEEKQGKFFVGPAGQEMDRALRMGGIKRRDVHVTTAMLCKVPGYKLRVYLQKLNKMNREAAKEAKAAGLEPPVPVPSPIDCCSPRLQAEIEPFQKFITLGGTGMTAVTGITASIMANRGGLTVLDATERTPARQVMPTLHPAFLLKNQRWAHVFRNDIAKAGRWFRGQADWVPPIAVYHPSPAYLREFLKDPRIGVFDLETDGIEALTAKIRCVGIGFEDKVVVCGFLGKDGHTKFYTPKDEAEIKQILCDYFTDPSIVKAGHNAGYYDKIVLQAQWGITATPIIDTMLLHRSVESELPHGLAYVGSLYTEAPSWKYDRAGNKLSHGSESDEELHVYCGLDVGVTARVLPPLVDHVNLRNQVGVWQIDQKMQAICADMHTAGMYVDQAQRMEEEQRMLKRRYVLLEGIRSRLGKPDFNPGSIYQVRDVLFEDWGLTPALEDKERYTSAGDPSTNDLVLRALLTDRGVNPDQRALIKLLRYYRKVQKVLGTYVVKLRPWNMVIEDDLGWDDDEEWADKETRKKYGVVKRGIVDPRTGRMHPGYNAHVANCVDPATWLVTAHGLTQIGALQGFGPPQTEAAADCLQLHDGVAFAPVSHLQNPGVCSTRRIETVLGVELIATPHHCVQKAAKKKFLRRDSKGKWHPTEPDSEWVRMDALAVGDYIKVPIGMNVWGNQSSLPPVARLPSRTCANEIWLPTCVDEDLGLFLGAYTADGSFHDGNGSFSIRLSDTTAKVEMDVVEEAAVRLFGPEAVRRSPDGLHVTSVSLASWCEMLGLGRGRENKSIPACILAASKPVVLAFIRGLSLDSNVTLNGGVTPLWHYSGTKALAQAFQMILFNLGIPSGLHDERTPKGPLSWGLSVSGADVYAIADITGQSVPVPTREADRTQTRPKYIRRGQTLWLRIRKAEEAGLRQVLDVTIPTTHQFWANGTVSHNTGRLSSSKPINCFDGETEILTPVGWVRFDSLPQGLPVAQWHGGGAIDFVVPSAYHEGRHTGEMIAFRNQSADLLMTPNHRVPLMKATGMNETVTAEALLTLGAGRSTWHAGKLRRPAAGLPFSLDELRLLVAIHADGSFVRVNGKAYGVDLGFTKQRKIERLRGLLVALGSAYTWSQNKGRFYLASTPRLEELIALVGREKRVWGSWLLQLDPAQAGAFEEELWLWDACVERRSQYANKDEANVDWIQAFLCTHEIRTNKRYYTNKEGHSVWVLDVRRTRTNAITAKAERERVLWDDLVYCVTVPSDAIVVRRRGKVTITRQSQNFPKGMRGMIIAAPGNILVGADMDQLELRIAAARWQVALYLRAFVGGKDPHSMTAFAVFGDAFLAATGLTADQFERPGKLVSPSYIDGKFEGTGEDKKMRDLSKAVQYASISAGSKVVLLDSRGEAPIEEVKPGDRTWAWSTKRHRYEPTEVKHVWCHGTKPCVRVTFTWGQGDRWQESVVVTADHPMLLRNGKLRHAGSLKPGDRLLPFRRKEMQNAQGSSAASKKAWIGRRERQDTDRTFGKRASKLDHYVELIGVKTDEEVAALASCTAALVGLYRKEHNIDPPVGQKGWLRWLLTNDITWHRLLHDNTDVEMVRLVQEIFLVTVHRTAVYNTRKLLGVPAVAKGRKETYARRRSKLDSWSERIGREPDVAIAREAGCSVPTVHYYRKTRGIPAYWKETPEGTNHRVVSVEAVGMCGVWDIEVDHEDHNFPLAAGIFVHNSQYLAKVETVHQLICKTEVPARDAMGKLLNDGTTDLPYALLPLKRVRGMHTNWMDGAPEFKTGWDREISTFRRQGYLTEDVTGRRRDFLDGEAPNELVNFPIQSSAAGLMNRAIIQLHEAIPLNCWGPGTGIINQCHDSIVVECPIAKEQYVRGLLEECLNQTHSSLPGVVFSASAASGQTWKAVG